MRQSPAQRPRGPRASRTQGCPPLSLRPDSLGPGYTPLLLQTRQGRLRGALGLSVVGHVAAVVLVIFVASLLPEQRSTALLPDLEQYHMVWILPEDPGGGGGGATESLEVPLEAQVPEENTVTVPVEEPPELEQPTEEDEPEPQPDLTLPVLKMVSAEEALDDILQGLSAFSMGSSRTAAGAGDDGGAGPGEGGGSGGGVYRPGPGIRIPVPLREVRPRYTADAMRAKVEGSVLLEAVVLPDGTVGDIQLIKSLDPTFGLDEEALKAARQWRFRPGTRLGEPVAVRVSLTLTFTLR